MQNSIIQHRESARSVPWRSLGPPERILALRLQALGDVIITLPYLQALRKSLPSASFHFLTREEFCDIPKATKLFDRVFTLGGGRDVKCQFMKALALVPSLRKERYDIVIDLQRNSLSRMVRWIIHPAAYSEFDRFSPSPAGERTGSTIEKLGLPPTPGLPPGLALPGTARGPEKPDDRNYHPANNLIILNPAGNWVTKNWPLENYSIFAKGWIERVDRDARFLMLGVDMMRDKAAYLKLRLGDRLISLVGETSQSEALAMVQRARLVISEDSAIMHMAWVSKVPVVALFGSTKSVWSKPLGPWSVYLDSSDLECGACSRPACRFGDVRCLARRSPDLVIETASELLRKKDAAESEGACATDQPSL